MADVATTDSHPLDTMLAISNVIQNERQASVYARVFELETPTVQEIAAGIESSTTTVYEDVDHLVDVGLLDRVTETQPHRFRSRGIDMSVHTETEYRVTPVLLIARARADVNETIERYVNRHGIGGLATAVEYARAYVQGETNARLMARDLDMPVYEAELILQELHEIILEVEPERVDEVDIDALDEAVSLDALE